MTPSRPRLVGTANGVATRQRIYRVDDGLEMHDIDHYAVTRKRVFFDEVTAMTYHRETGWAFVILLAIPGLVFAAVAILAHEEAGVWITFAIFAALFLVPAALRLWLRVDVITVFGKRTRVRMKYTFRKAHARKVFAEISGAVSAIQRRLTEQIARETVAAAPAVPLPPEQRAMDASNDE